MIAGFRPSSSTAIPCSGSMGTTCLRISQRFPIWASGQQVHRLFCERYPLAARRRRFSCHAGERVCCRVFCQRLSLSGVHRIRHPHVSDDQWFALGMFFAVVTAVTWFLIRWERGWAICSRARASSRAWRAIAVTSGTVRSSSRRSVYPCAFRTRAEVSCGFQTKRSCVPGPTDLSRRSWGFRIEGVAR